ncbi:MAG: sphingomyelin phosphodiesterase [Flavobacteriales bacterium]|nr:sphingomyelin phosphodiesterase [Flavobacteriales bacterium]
MKKFLIVFLMLVCSFELAAQSDTVKLLSWNIFMRPREVMWNVQIPRSKKIVQCINEHDVDIVVFQELFDGRSKRIIKRGLKSKFPFFAGPGKRGFWKLNSGVMIFSKYPLSESFVETYECGCMGADCLAKKGFVFTEVKVRDKKFQILGTHLQSLGGRARKERLCQFEQMNSAAERKLVQGIPQIFIGDMNTAKGNEEAFGEMLNTLTAEDGELSGDFQYTSKDSLIDLVDPNYGDTNIIDYILLKKNKSKARMVYREVLRFRKPHRRGIKDLSDHLAVYGILIL